MMNRFLRRKTLLCTLLLAIPPLLSQGLSWLGVDAGPMLLLNAEPDSGPSPLLYTLGLSMPIRQTDGGFYWEARYGFFHTRYLYADGKASPAEREAAGSLWTLGLDLESSLGYRFDLGRKVRIGGGFCLATVFRLPLVPIGDTYWKETFAYLMARFLYTGLEMRMDWMIQEKLILSGALLGLYPFFLAWEKGDVDYWDQIIVKAALSFRFPPGSGRERSTPTNDGEP